MEPAAKGLTSQVNTSSEPVAVERDCLFISYATEDAAFVRWLALKLSACGYKVWWDRDRLHGGGAFPSEIDQAIKVKAFRVLAVLSHHSSSKPNPERERTIALAVGRERNEDFLIPLNLELKASELPWMTSNLSFVSFMDNWAAGLAQLLDDLRHAGAPCFAEQARSLVGANLSQTTFIVDVAESVWLNCFAIADVPLGLSRYEWSVDVDDAAFGSWVHHREGPRVSWSFEAPPAGVSKRSPARDQYALNPSTRVNGVNVNHVATSLLRQYVEARCFARGLAQVPGARVFYFPETLEIASRLPFILPSGRQTWVRPVGTRRIWQRGVPEQVRYHLAFTFRIELGRLGTPLLQVRPTVHFMTMSGGEIDARRNVRRAKAVRRAWYNDKWLARVAAFGSYLADDADSWKLTESLPTTISRAPLWLESATSLDEVARRKALKVDAESDGDEVDEGDLHVDDDDGDDGDE